MAQHAHAEVESAGLKVLSVSDKNSKVRTVQVDRPEVDKGRAIVEQAVRDYSPRDSRVTDVLAQLAAKK